MRRAGKSKRIYEIINLWPELLRKCRKSFKTASYWLPHKFKRFYLCPSNPFTLSGWTKNKYERIAIKLVAQNPKTISSKMHKIIIKSYAKKIERQK